MNALLNCNEYKVNDLYENFRTNSHTDIDGTNTQHHPTSKCDRTIHGIDMLCILLEGCAAVGLRSLLKSHHALRSVQMSLSAIAVVKLSRVVQRGSGRGGRWVRSSV